MLKTVRNYHYTVYVLLAGIFLLVSSGITQIMGQDDGNGDAKVQSENSVQDNNTIILEPSEINGTYRWVNSSGVINPTLDITKSNAYEFKINNPTDEKHELIIETDNKSKVGGSESIKAGKNTEFQFKAVQTGELNYYCEYHPESMRGIIKVTEPTH